MRILIFQIVIFMVVPTFFKSWNPSQISAQNRRSTIIFT
ncbi:hypothetical protein LEP1GSC127_4981 [Leptospira kirschneri str. 200801925]|uniref:Uncharacterized protein n=1 Tax=Leptospira kirschneri str. 200802841 TaxID=1193047 RepID=A0A828Y659_9LEPT|nr:hypothetical protein LEP1GSC131_0233 [Leptospira kirschneri str. 200802841]EKQ84292.1 hypothetical protein LEP1GSC064_3347 [Leptospira kirschneri serovar Grippotyphosa str. Moskva]EMO78024.1 hypothetical protein LEP1GSC127_4981 [Leptospira kirschneri str. 200801925]